MITLGLYGAFGWEADKSFNNNGEHTWVHDSGATLVVNGNHVCSISEERLTRRKHDGNFPEKSIEYCLSMANISADAVDLVCIPSMSLDIFYKKWVDGTIHGIVKNIFPCAEIMLLSHHLCHAAAAVFSSDLSDGSFITLDGAGSAIFDQGFEKLMVETNTIGYFNKPKGIFRLFNGAPGTNNFGGYYHWHAQQIYCEKTQNDIHWSNEKYRETWPGKIMGLSAYGMTADSYQLKGHFTSKELAYGDAPYIVFDKDFVEENGVAKNADEKAFLLQKNFETALVSYIQTLKEASYLEDNLCLSGGCFLNVLANSLVKNTGLFNAVHIPPFPNDEGLHFGAACFGQFKKQKAVQMPTNLALLGKQYSKYEIEQVLESFNLTYKKYDDFNELCDFVSLKLSENKIVAWFQNRSEFGPRALGARSILMHPGPKENKEVLNSRVKHREYWRPFAGIILDEHLADYFDNSFESPYMLYSLKVKEDKVDSLGAITHIDNTCRIQTINHAMNPQTTNLIRKFEQKTGIPVLLNTSFNDNGEPIVESPFDAVTSFFKMDIDLLAIGDFVVERRSSIE